MSIIYPRTPPATPVARTSRIRPVTIAAEARSPFTGSAETYEYEGQYWELDVTLPRMRRATAAAWTGWLTSLKGKVGSFLWGDHDARVPLGAPTGQPVVDGGLQSGQTVVTRGWVPNSPGILAAGDYIQIGSGGSARLYMVLSPADADGVGAATLDIFPRLRDQPPDSTPIITSYTVGRFKLTTNRPYWDADQASIYGISFSAIEDF